MKVPRSERPSKQRKSLNHKTNTSTNETQNLPVHLSWPKSPQTPRKIGYKVPTAAEDNNYAGSDPDGLNFFGRLQKSPEYYETFTGHMEA